MNREKIIRTVKNIFFGIVAVIEKVLAFIFDAALSLLGIFFSILEMGSVIITGCLIVGIVACIGIYIWIKPTLDECRDTAYDIIANVSEGDFISAMDTYVYDNKGEVIGLINAGNYEYVSINDISMNIQNMYISQEDKRFKEHTGVDWIATARAFLALLKNGGDITQGGSTITQQVIKNVYLTQEQSFERKIIEILLAPQIEAKFSKAQIMEYYCNTNYYGNRCYGVQAASQYYFGKDAKDVTVAEAAVLVSISNSPSAYDPVTHYSACLEKRNSVIETYYENGYIDEMEKEAALNEVFTVQQNASEETLETYQSSYAVHCAALAFMKQENFDFKYVFEDKEDYDAYMEKYNYEYNAKTEEIRGGGYHIYTSLDSDIQAIVQESLDSGLSSFTEVDEDTGKYALQGAAVVADNETGYVVAIVGGRGTEDQYNRGYLSARQPGSAIKPLIDYAPAFDTGDFYPSKIMNDYNFEGSPKNSGGSYRGLLPLREAVNRSINTVAWQVLDEIGVNNGLAYLGEMEFQKITYVDNDVSALAIGGFTNGLRVVDMAKGYQTLANGGIYNDNTCIVEILDSQGNIVLSDETEEKKVYEPDSAYMMTDVLKGTISEPYGTGYGLALSNGMPCAGKTGTTNNNRDTWFCGYTKYYTMSVWVGYDTPRDMPGIFGSTYAGPIWKTAMNRIHEGLEPKDWDMPDTVYISYYDPATGEPTQEDTGVTDLFSSLAEKRKEEYEKQKQEEAFLAEIEKEVSAYEKKTISSPEDTYTVDDDFKAVNNTISEIYDTETRMVFYERIYAKYQELLSIKESMSDEMAVYESLAAEEEKRKAEEEEERAEREREAFIREMKETEAEEAIKALEALEYIPSTDTLLNRAKEAVEELMDYSSYTLYFTRLEAAASYVESLPIYAEYLEQKREEEEREREAEARRLQAEEEERQRKEEALNQITILQPQEETESATWPGAYQKQEEQYGPGYE